MSFTVEDGTGADPDANSYVAVAEFVEYFTDRGFDYTVYPTPAIQRALIKATDYIEVENGRWFIGYASDVAQPLSWPRTCAYIPLGAGQYKTAEGIPQLLKHATCEYARRVLTSDTGDLQPDPVDRDETGQIKHYVSEKIGPIETKVDYITGTGSEVRSYPAADKLLLPLLRSWGGGSVRN